MTLVRQVDNAIVRSPLLIVLIHFNIDIHIYKFIISIFEKHLEILVIMKILFHMKDKHQ